MSYFPESDTIRVNSAYRLKHPFADGAECVMRERIHIIILEAVLRRPTVPSLPDACCAMLYRESPRRECIVMEQAICDIVTSEFVSDTHQVFCADKTRREKPAAFLYVLNEVIHRNRAFIFGQKIERERKHIYCLRIALDTSVVGNISLVERRLDIVKQFLIFFRIICFAYDSCGLCNDSRAFGEICRRKNISRGYRSIASQSP